MACFGDLAFETLVQILSPLSCGDLASTCGLSRILYAICQPLLYKSPCLAPPMINQRATASSLEMFLWTILRPGNEILASHVRSLRVEWDNVARSPPTDISFLTTAASRLNFRYPLESQAGQLILLLHLLPCLTVLELSCAPSESSVFTQFMESNNDLLFPPPHTLPLGLRSLRQFRCPYSAAVKSSGLSPTIVFRLLMLPSVHSIDVHAAYYGRFQKTAFNDAFRRSLVSELRLKYIDRPPPANEPPLTYRRAAERFSLLAYTLTLPRGLTRFWYSVTVADNNLNLLEFLLGLAPLQGTLQFLHLDFAGDGDTGTSDPDEYYYSGPTTLGSFREWPVLRSLSCSLVPLLGNVPTRDPMRLVQVLPPALCEFEMLQAEQWWGTELEAQVKELMAEKESVVPTLKRLAFTPTDWWRVKDACVAADVELVPGPLEW